MLQAGRPLVRFPTETNIFSNLPQSSSRVLGLGLAQPLTEVSTRNLPGGRARPASKLRTLPPSVCRLSENVTALKSHNSIDLYSLLLTSAAGRLLSARLTHHQTKQKEAIGSSETLSIFVQKCTTS
jgi:hypothetical protein